MTATLCPLEEWFRVSFDQCCIMICRNPPGLPASVDKVYWADIEHICLKTAEDFLFSDELYLFSCVRPESYVVPIDAAGGLELWNEIIRRGLFDAKLAIQASATNGEFFVWPPVKN